MIKEGGIVDKVAIQGIVYVEKVIQIRTFGYVIDKAQTIGFCKADNFFCARAIIQIFDTAKIGGVVEELDKVRFGQQKNPHSFVGGGIKVGVFHYASVFSVRRGGGRFFCLDKGWYVKSALQAKEKENTKNCSNGMEKFFHSRHVLYIPPYKRRFV